MLAPFIDTHVHFWDRARFPYDWLDSVPSIAAAHTPADLRAEAGKRLPERIVFVECGAPWRDEINWIEQLAATEPRIQGIVAKIEIDSPATVSATIAELQRHPLVRGVRHNIQDEPDPGFCLRPEFVSAMRELGRARLSFDICCRHHQLASVVALVERCPETRFVLDHAGKPDIRTGLLDPWRSHIAALAALPNVDCKLSGLITEADHAHWTVAHLRPYVAHLLATFGPSRLTFGSDWPVAKLAGGYARWLDAAHELLSDLPADARRAILHDNALCIYRLG